MGSDPGTDRTWTLGVCPECDNAVVVPSAYIPPEFVANHRHAMHEGSRGDVGRDVPREAVIVVEESRVREAEATIARYARSLAEVEVHASDNNRRVERLEAELREARQALHVLICLKDGPRDETYRAGKDAAWDRARGVLEKGDTGPVA